MANGETEHEDLVSDAELEAYIGPIRTGLAAMETAADWMPAGRFEPASLAHARSSRTAFAVPADDGFAGLPGSLEDLCYLPMTELAALVKRRQVSATEAVEAYAGRIERLGPGLNAYITTTLEAALARAQTTPAGRLGGVPMAIKDIVEIAGVPATGGSRLMRGRVPARDATAWRRLHAEGAILLGKSHTHEFASGPTGENETYGPARNPWRPDRITGGSSSGSAAAVAAGLASAAIGTDTGGSIRIPAALCGVVGLKPTYGRVDTTGVYPLSWSLDHVGPLTRTVRDAGRLLDILGPDGETSCEGAAVAGAHGSLRGVRVGVLRAWAEGVAQAEVWAAFTASLEALRSLGAEVREATLPVSADLLMAVNRAITLPEASAWHAPYMEAGRGGEYGRNILPRLEAGRRLPALLYVKAQRLRSCLVAQTASVWGEFDVLALPTVPVAAPAIGAERVRLGDGREAPTAMSLLAWCGPFNVLGTPALSLPCGRTGEGLPIGLQLAAAPADDAFLCYVGAAAAQILDGRRERPPLDPA